MGVVVQPNERVRERERMRERERNSLHPHDQSD